MEFFFADSALEKKNSEWKKFISQHLKTDQVLQVHFDSEVPTIVDAEKRKFKIDFLNDHLNYNKKKSSISKEPLAKALGGGAKGHKLLDLSAGLGVDAVFLYQLDFQVTALERNPLIYMALKIASQQIDEKINFIFTDAKEFLQKLKPQDFDAAYFDPMFPEKKKSALPKQEMVFFKNLVGQDPDAGDIVKYAVDKKLFKRFVVKRPISAEPFLKPSGSIEGKIIRYDIYGV